MSDSSTEAISLPGDLVDILDEQESSPNDFDEAEPSFALWRLIMDNEEATDGNRKAVLAEVAALQMQLLHEQKRSRWNTRFGPIEERTTEDGKYHCFPDIAEFDDAIVSYLERRATETSHPVLEARYADFLWDITKTATGKSPSIEMARKAIDSYVKCCRRFPDSHQTADRLSRALEIALSVGDKTRTDQVIDAMLGLLTVSEFPGSQVMWVFDVLNEQNKVTLSGEQQEQLVHTLEAELEQICGLEKPVGIVAKEPAIRLARHYERLGKPDEVKRVIRAFGQATEDFAKGADGLVAMSWLQDAYKIYVQFGMKNEAESLQLAAKEKGKEAEDQMVHHSITTEIPQEEVENLFENLTSDDLESSFSRISINFLPRIEDIRKQLEEMQKSAKLLSMISQSVMDNQQIIARAGSIDSDPEGRLMLQMSQDIRGMASLLGGAIDWMRSKYDFSPQTMRAYLSKSLLFDESRMPFFDRAMEAYLADDHITVIHVLVPQIEHSLRKLLSVLGKPTNKHRRADRSVMVEKSLNDILEAEPVLVQCLGNDFVFYLRMFLCDPCGFNVRNNLAHGLMEPDKFNRGISDRLLHIVWLLAFIRKSESTEAENSPST